MAALRQEILELKESEAKRQKALEELGAAGERFRILLDHLPLKVFTKDKNSVYLFCTQSYSADLKRKPEEIAGKIDHDLHPAELAEKLAAEDRRILAAGSPESRQEEFLREGYSVILHSFKTPVKDEKGEAMAILQVSWEVTDQKRKEEELKKFAKTWRKPYPGGRHSFNG